MSDNTLFPLEQYTQPAPDKPKKTERWYLWCDQNGQRWALMATHSNGGDEWDKMSPTMRRPHLYKTYGGARRAAEEHGSNVRVELWRGKPSKGGAK